MTTRGSHAAGPRRPVAPNRDTSDSLTRLPGGINPIAGMEELEDGHDFARPPSRGLRGHLAGHRDRIEW